MKMKIIIYLLGLLAAFGLTSCSQNEGFGGNSNIQGQLITRYYNSDFTVFQGEEPAIDEEIFIVFGDNKTIGDNVETSFDGSFELEYLWPGKYQLFYKTDDTTVIALDQTTISIDINLNKNETHDLGKIYQYKLLDWDEGTGKIKGRVIVTNYNNTSTYPNLEMKDRTPAQEQEVYLTYNNEDFYCERIRTQGDGTFVFPNLLIGKYSIYVYSEDVITGGTANIVKKVEIEITQKGEVISLDDIHIDKH
jgi:hypothetical protein